MRVILSILLTLCTTGVSAQAPLDWGDQGNGTYKNPVLNADYSDPDVIRVGSKYYMVASDFHFLGMQVLEQNSCTPLSSSSMFSMRSALSGSSSSRRAFMIPLL